VTEAAVSKGCPGDVDDDSYLAEDDTPLNDTHKKFSVLGKIAFYPLGISGYMDHIAQVVRLAMDKGLYVESSHYATMLKGDINDIFEYFNAVLAYAEPHIAHHVLHITLSVNSPSVTD